MAQVQAVYFGTVAAAITSYRGDTAVQVRVPAGASTNPIRVALTTSATARRYSGAAYFSILPSIPIVTGYSPAIGKLNDTVRIQGRRLQGFVAARFNGAKALYSRVQGDSLIVVTVPIGSTTGPLQVQTSSNVTTAGVFTILPPPTITSYSPGWGRPGDKIRVRGTGLSTTGQIFLGTLDAGPVYASGDTLVTFRVPAGALSGRIKVVAATGTAQTTSYFTITPYPSARIDAINPLAAVKGSTVTFRGVRFTGARYVRFGSGAAVAAVQVLSDTQMTAIVPQNAVTGRVDAGTPYGLITSTDVFTVLNLAARSGADEAAALAPNAGLQLCPNPSPGGQATLRLPDAPEGSYTLYLYAADGQLMQTATSTGAELQAGKLWQLALPKGTYLIRMTGPVTRQCRLMVE